jgi:uncharacterized protein YegP (UPF0339 family)
MAKQTQIEVYSGHCDTEWYWRARHKNGHILCDGSEAFSSKANAKRSARRIVGSLTNAPIVEVA